MAEVTPVKFDFRWAYDLKPTVVEIDPGVQYAKVTKLKPVKHLTIVNNGRASSSNLFPEEFFAEEDPVEIWKTEGVNDPNYDSEDAGDLFSDLANAEVGTIYPVTLVYIAASFEMPGAGFTPAVSKTPSKMTSNQRVLTFGPGELEKIIKETKAEFSRLISKTGIRVNDTKIYPTMRPY